MRTHQLRTPGEPTSPPAARLTGTPDRRGRRVTAAALVTATVLLGPGLTASAGAAVPSTAKARTATVPNTVTLPICLTGYSNSYEFYTWCQGAAPAGFRTIAYCADGDAVLGVEYADGSGSLSYADCSATDGLDSTLDTEGWGILLCSADNGAGTYAGYIDTVGDISGIVLNWGAGNITTGGTTLCDYSTGKQTSINTVTPPT